MTLIEAVREALREEMERDESVFRDHDLSGAQVLNELVAEVGVGRP